MIPDLTPLVWRRVLNEEVEAIALSPHGSGDPFNPFTTNLQLSSVPLKLQTTFPSMAGLCKESCCGRRSCTLKLAVTR